MSNFHSCSFRVLIITIVTSIQSVVSQYDSLFDIGPQSYFTRFRITLSSFDVFSSLDCESYGYSEFAQGQPSINFTHGVSLKSTYLNVPTECDEEVLGPVTIGLLCGKNFFLYELSNWRLIGSLTHEGDARFIQATQYGYSIALLSIGTHSGKRCIFLSYVNSFDGIYMHTTVTFPLNLTKTLPTLKYMYGGKDESRILVYFEAAYSLGASVFNPLNQTMFYIVRADATGTPTRDTVWAYMISFGGEPGHRLLATIYDMFTWNNVLYIFHRFVNEDSLGEQSPLRIIPWFWAPGGNLVTRELVLSSKSPLWRDMNLDSLMGYHLVDLYVLFYGFTVRIEDTNPQAVMFVCKLKEETIEGSKNPDLGAEFMCSNQLNIDQVIFGKHEDIFKPTYSEKHMGENLRIFLEAKSPDYESTIYAAFYYFDAARSELSFQTEWSVKSGAQWMHVYDGKPVLTSIRGKSIDTFASETRFAEIDFTSYYAQPLSNLCLTRSFRSSRNVCGDCRCLVQREAIFEHIHTSVWDSVILHEECAAEPHLGISCWVQEERKCQLY